MPSLQPCKKEQNITPPKNHDAWCNLSSLSTFVPSHMHPHLLFSSQAGDARPAATALQEAWLALKEQPPPPPQQQQDQQQQQQAADPSSSPSQPQNPLDVTPSPEQLAASRGLAGWSTPAPASTSNKSSSSSGSSSRESHRKPLLDQEELSTLLQQRLGYSIAVGPSRIKHHEAGLGLFLRGDCPPGALLALFPGLVYLKDNYRRMHNYPKVDKKNPYLTARYDGGVVDSKPWGRGWMWVEEGGAGEHGGQGATAVAQTGTEGEMGNAAGGSSPSESLPAEAVGGAEGEGARGAHRHVGSVSGTIHNDTQESSSSSASNSSQFPANLSTSRSSSINSPGRKRQGAFRPPPVPELPSKKGVFGRMIAASDGPRLPPPPTTWVLATTAEAAALELLEGRNPLALAHYANHPGEGMAPNVMIASFSFKSGKQGVQGEAGVAGGGEEEEEGRLRAYVPNINYAMEITKQQVLEEVSWC